MGTYQTLLRVALASSLLGGTVVGCNDDKGDSGNTPGVDLDEDGYGEGPDCDDNSAGVYPGADERCNGIDDNCDGEVDEAGAVDGVPGYPDADGDGWGEDGTGTVCPGTTGYVSSGGDCDDASAAISPSATETCDAVDNDCDGLTDEPGTADGAEYHLDQDGDGYGHPINVGIACAPGDGYAENGLDCDDQDPGRSPDISELCNNRVDDDCDGTVDETDGADAPTWYTDADGDGFGVADGPTAESCDQPDGFSYNADDCDDTNPDVNPDERDSEDGIDNDCDGEVDEGGAIEFHGGVDEYEGRYDESRFYGYYIVGLYNGGDDWQCLLYYGSRGYEVTSELACDSCDFSYYIESEWYEGVYEDDYEECDWADLSYWPEVEAFGTIWSFSADPDEFGDPVAYYYYWGAGEWLPASYYLTDSYGYYYGYYDLLQWTFFMEESDVAEYEVGLFAGYTYRGWDYGDTGDWEEGDVDVDVDYDTGR